MCQQRHGTVVAASARKRNENKNKKEKKEKSKSEINSRSLLWSKRKQKCNSRCSFIRISLLSFIFYLEWHFFRRCVIWSTYTSVTQHYTVPTRLMFFTFIVTIIFFYFCRVSLFFFTSCRVLIVSSIGFWVSFLSYFSRISPRFALTHNLFQSMLILFITFHIAFILMKWLPQRLPPLAREKEMRESVYNSTKRNNFFRAHSRW